MLFFAILRGPSQASRELKSLQPALSQP